MAKEAVREQILEAAEQRFAQYGWQKTTMAEIAGDCRMSAANLYRYFRNKEDLAQAIARHYFQQMQDGLRAVIERPGLTAAQQIEAMVLAMLQLTYERFSAKPGLLSLVDYITQSCWDLVEPETEVEQRLFESILEQAMARGEFARADVTSTAQAMCSALAKFHMPQFMGCYSLEELQGRARGVVNLLVRGLLPR